MKKVIRKTEAGTGYFPGGQRAAVLGQPLWVERSMSENGTFRREATLAHRNGLHLTPIQQVVRAASEFSAVVQIHFDDKAANAKSAMELMLLGATQGAILAVEGSGPNADQAVDAVATILETCPD